MSWLFDSAVGLPDVEVCRIVQILRGKAYGVAEFEKVVSFLDSDLVGSVVFFRFVVFLQLVVFLLSHWGCLLSVKICYVNYTTKMIKYNIFEKD